MIPKTSVAAPARTATNMTSGWGVPDRGAGRLRGGRGGVSSPSSSGEPPASAGSAAGRRRPGEGRCAGAAPAGASRIHIAAITGR